MHIYTLDEMLNDDTVAPEPIIGNGILPERALLLISGKPKAKKSFLAYNLAMAVAAGKSFACFKVTAPAKTLILSAEGGHFPNRDRLKTMAKQCTLADKTMLSISSDARIKLDRDPDMRELVTIIKSLAPKVVVMDPLIRFHTKEENAASDMATVFGRIRSLIEDLGVSVILVHHQGKDDSGGIAARGSSVILGEYDSFIQIQKGEERQRLDFDMRHVATPDPLWLKFNPVSLWFEQEVAKSPPVVKLVNVGEAVTKNDLVQRALSEGLFSSRNAPYKAIRKALEDGHFRLTDKGLYTLAA